MSQNVRKKGDVAGSFANPIEASCVVRASVSSVKTYLFLKVIASTCDEPVVREASSLFDSPLIYTKLRNTQQNEGLDRGLGVNLFVGHKPSLLFPR